MGPRKLGVLLRGGLRGVSGCSASSHDKTSSAEAPRQPAKNGAAQADGGVPAPLVGGETLTRNDSQSTFALDVDTASYTYSARQIADGRWPDQQSVRAEEF